MIELQPCGTPAAYRRHGKHKEPRCDDCRVAYNAYVRSWRLRGSRSLPVLSTLITELVELHGSRSGWGLFWLVDEARPDVKLAAVRRAVCRMVQDGRLVKVPGVDSPRYRLPEVAL